MDLQGMLANAFSYGRTLQRSDQAVGKEKRMLVLICLRMYAHYESIMGSRFTDIDSLTRIVIIKLFTEGSFQMASVSVCLRACKCVDVGVL